MSDVVLPAIFGAALLAMVGAIFGVCIARLLWADDLRHAYSLRETSRKTEDALHSIVQSQSKQIELLRSQLKQPTSP